MVIASALQVLNCVEAVNDAFCYYLFLDMVFVSVTGITYVFVEKPFHRRQQKLMFQNNPIAVKFVIQANQRGPQINPIRQMWGPNDLQFGLTFVYCAHYYGFPRITDYSFMYLRTSTVQHKVSAWNIKTTTVRYIRGLQGFNVVRANLPHCITRYLPAGNGGYPNLKWNYRPYLRSTFERAGAF